MNDDGLCVQGAGIGNDQPGKETTILGEQNVFHHCKGGHCCREDMEERKKKVVYLPPPLGPDSPVARKETKHT